jgi:hypothetical protein
VVTFCARQQRDNLLYPSGSLSEILRNPAKVIKSLVNSFIQSDPRISIQTQSILEAAKHVPRPWKGNGHRAEFPKDLVPLLHTSAFLPAWDAVQDFPQAFNAVRGQLDGHVDSIYNPTQYQLHCTPRAVTFQQFLHGDGITAVLII